MRFFLFLARHFPKMWKIIIIPHLAPSPIFQKLRNRASLSPSGQIVRGTDFDLYS